MDRNTVQVRSVKDMTQDEQNTKNLEAIATVANAIEADEQFVIAVLHGDQDKGGSCELNGSMSAGNLEVVAKMLSLQSVLGQVDDPQAFLDRIVASHSTEDVA
jgi:hypothetical protein